MAHPVYGKYNPDQVIRTKIDTCYGPAGSLFKVVAVSDGRNSSSSTVPISAVILNKDGGINQRKKHCWAGFTHGQVEIIAQSYSEWLKTPADLCAEAEELGIRLAAKLDISREAARALLAVRFMMSLDKLAKTPVRG